MTPRTHLPVFLPAALALVACAGSPATQPQTQVGAKKAPIAAEIAASPIAPVVPVPDAPPDDLVMQGRITNLRVSWANADRLLISNRAAPIGASHEVILMGMIGPTLADLVDITQPLDIAVFGEATDRFVLSMVVDPEVAPRIGRVVTWRPENGMLTITGFRGEPSPMEPMLSACALTNPEEDPVLRLVCASDETLLAGAGGYLGRKVAREANEGDVRIELNTARLFASLTHEPTTAKDSQAEALGEGLSKAFLRDIGKLSFVGGWGKNEIDAEFVLGFSSASSPLSQVLTARPSASARPPELFWRLPKDAAFAMYGQGADARALAPLRDELLKALTADMVNDGYDRGLLDAFGERVSALFFTGGPVALAMGVDRTGAEAALAAYSSDELPVEKGTSKPKAEAARKADRARAFSSMRSWLVMGVEEPAEKWTKGLLGVVDAGNALDLKKNGGIAKGSPKGQTNLPKATGKEDDRDTTNVVTAPLSPSAPKGSLHLEIRTRPLVDDAPPAHTSHIYVVPDGARTWIGVAESEAEVLTRLRLVREGSSDKTIVDMPELDLPRSSGASAGGFLTIAGMMQLFADADRDAALLQARADFQKLALLPARGETIVPWVLLAEDAPAGGSRVRIKSRLVVSALGDLMAIAR